MVRLYARVHPLVEKLDRLPDTFAELHHRAAPTLHLAASDTAASFIAPKHLASLRATVPDMRFQVDVASGTQCLRWLAAYPHIAHPRSHYIRRYGEMHLAQHGVSACVAVEAEGWLAIKHCVEQGAV